MSGALQGRVVWVVGASGVIGSAVAPLLASEGASLALSGRPSDRLENAAKAAREFGGKVSIHEMDVRDRKVIKGVADRIAAEFGGIDGLVNSMAVPLFGDFMSLTDDDWEQVLDTKLFGYLRTMRAAIPHMKARGGGSIVNISGRGGRQPTPAHLPGGAANAAVNLVSKGLCDVFWPDHIRVNVVAPGPVVSERFDKIRESNTRAWGGDNLRASLDRMAQPLDIANAVSWYLSDKSSHVTGTVLAVDGGGTATV